MGEDQYQGTLASGGTFIADGRGIHILDPAGNQLASFGRDVISGVRRDGQVVTLERHSDTIVTLTTASITDAVGLESYVRDAILTPEAALEPDEAPLVPPPPMAFDAIDDDHNEGQDVAAGAALDEPARPPIISQPDDADDERPQHDLPEPVSTSPPVAELPETIAEPEQLPPPPAVEALPAESADGEGGRRLWLWGCLGCLGLVIAAAICVGVLAATGVLDELAEDDATPTPFIIVATSDDAEPTADESSGGVDPTTPENGEGTATDAGSAAGDGMQPGETGTVDGLELTMLSSRTDGGGIVPPDEGNEYLILLFEITNTTSEEVTVSTLLEFELLDSNDEEYSVALFADTETGLDTDIPAGDTIQGEVAFEVPVGSGPYIAIYESFLSNEQMRWQVS